MRIDSMRQIKGRRDCYKNGITVLFSLPFFSLLVFFVIRPNMYPRGNRKGKKGDKNRETPTNRMKKKI
jgi:hypothetical protein